MANRIKIRRGSGNPGDNLLSYELGWDTTNKALYINDGGTSKIAALPLTGGTLSGSITGSNSGVGFIQKLNDTSNWGLGLSWQKTTAYSESYRPGIGYHNTGDTNGALTLVPYATNTDPWNGTVGLYVGKNTFKWENNVILHSNNYTTYTVTKTGTGASGSWGISITGTAAKASGLVDGSSTMTSAYNKAGLAYANYTWLAGWNGYELRAVDKTQFAQASHSHSYLPLSGGTLSGNITSPSSNCTWIAGQNSASAAFNVGDANNTGSYWPWMRQTNTSSAKWFSFGTLNTSFYWIGSATSRTANGYDCGMNFDVATGKLLVDGVAVIRDSGTTSRRIWVTTSSSYSSSYANGDIVLVKA